MRLCNPEPPLQPSVTYYDCLPLLSPPGFIKKSIMNNGFHITTLARVVMCMYVLSASCIKGLGWLCFQYNSILLLTLLPSPPPPLPSWHQCFSLHLAHCQCPRLVALSVYISFCCHWLSSAVIKVILDAAHSKSSPSASPPCFFEMFTCHFRTLLDDFIIISVWSSILHINKENFLIVSNWGEWTLCQCMCLHWRYVSFNSVFENSCLACNSKHPVSIPFACDHSGRC